MPDTVPRTAPAARTSPAATSGRNAAPLALPASGVLLIALGVLTARRRGRPATISQSLAPKIRPWQAVGFAAAAVAVVTPVVLLIGR